MAYRFPEILRGLKPSKSSPKLRQTVCFRCPAFVADALEHIKQETGISRSELINQAIIGCFNQLDSGTLKPGYNNTYKADKSVSFATIQSTRNKLGELYVAWDLNQSHAIVKAIIDFYSIENDDVLDPAWIEQTKKFGVNKMKSRRYEVLLNIGCATAMVVPAGKPMPHGYTLWSTENRRTVSKPQDTAKNLGWAQAQVELEHALAYLDSMPQNA